MNQEIESQVETKVEEIRRNDAVIITLQKLANHYQVDWLELQTALLKRQVVLAELLTDFNKPSNPSMLSLYLKQQHALEMSLAERATKVIARAMEAVTTSEKLQEETARLLAKLRKEQEAKNIK
jgi:hypothetical protein